MDRKIELEHLARADRIVAEGERHIGHQEQIVAELDRDGHDTKQAVALLALLRRTQAEHVARRDFILKFFEQGRRDDRIFKPGQYGSVQQPAKETAP